MISEGEAFVDVDDVQVVLLVLTFQELKNLEQELEKKERTRIRSKLRIEEREKEETKKNPKQTVK